VVIDPIWIYRNHQNNSGIWSVIAIKSLNNYDDTATLADEGSQTSIEKLGRRARRRDNYGRLSEFTYHTTDQRF